MAGSPEGNRLAENVNDQTSHVVEQDSANNVHLQIGDEIDQSPPPPYSACIAGDGPETNHQWKMDGTSGPQCPPPPPFDFPSSGSAVTQPLLPMSQPIRVVVDQRGLPVSVPPGIQVVVVPARDSHGLQLSREDESRRMRSIALPLAVLSLFFGSMFCAIPALVCACRRHAPVMDYRRSIALSTIALLIGITGLVLAAIRANRNAMAYM